MGQAKLVQQGVLEKAPARQGRQSTRFVYGEPAGQVVHDRWGGRTALWHRMLAQHGTIVIAIDNRGTPSPRGRAFR